jgi:predicted nucleic acid-binding protein
MDVAESYRLSFYDGLYISPALKTLCKVVTADKKLYKSLRDGPVKKNILWAEDIPG